MPPRSTFASRHTCRCKISIKHACGHNEKVDSQLCYASLQGGRCRTEASGGIDSSFCRECGACRCVHTERFKTCFRKPTIHTRVINPGHYKLGESCKTTSMDLRHMSCPTCGPCQCDAPYKFGECRRNHVFYRLLAQHRSFKDISGCSRLVQVDERPGSCPRCEREARNRAPVSSHGLSTLPQSESGYNRAPVANRVTVDSMLTATRSPPSSGTTRTAEAARPTYSETMLTGPTPAHHHAPTGFGGNQTTSIRNQLAIQRDSPPPRLTDPTPRERRPDPKFTSGWRHYQSSSPSSGSPDSADHQNKRYQR